MTVVGGRVVDVPALLDAATGRSEYMRAWLAVMTRHGSTVAVPSTVRAQAAEQLTTAAELAELDWSCEGGTVLVVPLTTEDTAEVDALAKDHFHGDIVAAHVAVTAMRRHWPVITTEERAEMFQTTAIDTEALP